MAVQTANFDLVRLHLGGHKTKLRESTDSPSTVLGR
jgi:hypothetical protein